MCPNKSSIFAFDVAGKQAGEKVILGEYLLWCAQYAINGHFPSLYPFLVNKNEEEIGKGITAKEVLLVSYYYKGWWNLYNENITEAPHPPDGTPYPWF